MIFKRCLGFPDSYTSEKVRWGTALYYRKGSISWISFERKHLSILAFPNQQKHQVAKMLPNKEQCYPCNTLFHQRSFVLSHCTKRMMGLDTLCCAAASGVECVWPKKGQNTEWDDIPVRGVARAEDCPQNFGFNGLLPLLLLCSKFCKVFFPPWNATCA